MAKASPVTPYLVVFPRGQLSLNDKARMQKAGIMAVEADDPKTVAQMQLTQPLLNTQITGDAIVRAALQAIAEQPHSSGAWNAISSAGIAAHRFVQLLAATLAPVSEPASVAAGEK